MKPIFSFFGSTIGSKQNLVGSGISFVHDDSIRLRNLLGFDSAIQYEKNDLPLEPVDIKSFDNNLLEADNAEGLIFTGKPTGRIHRNHNFTIDVDPGYKYIEIFCGGIPCHLMESKDFFSKISFIIKIENGQLVPFNGQNITFRSTIIEIEIVFYKEEVPMTLKKSRLRFNEPKPKPKQDITSFPLPPKLKHLSRDCYQETVL